MTREPVDVAGGADPTDVVADEGYADGDYTMQNRGPGVLVFNDQDAVVADPTTLAGKGMTLYPRQFIGITVAGGALYLSSRSGCNVVFADAS